MIGKDTRVSGYMFESALESGLVAAGARVTLLGPMPTPAVAMLTRSQKASAGIVISASHNAYPDNGVKFFDGAGSKLSDELELEIERMLSEPMETVPSADLGKASRMVDARGRYVEFCKNTFPDKLSLNGLKLVLDCAHGATYQVAPQVFTELGADVVLIGAAPDGYNINHEVGSTSPAALQAKVLGERRMQASPSTEMEIVCSWWRLTAALWTVMSCSTSSPTIVCKMENHQRESLGP